MSCPFITMVPWVGSISRVSSRTSVDLPEPESPITTKTSPGATSKETSLTPITQPVLALRSARLRSASGLPMIFSARRRRRSSRDSRTESAAAGSACELSSALPSTLVVVDSHADS